MLIEEVGVVAGMNRTSANRARFTAEDVTDDNGVERGCLADRWRFVGVIGGDAVMINQCNIYAEKKLKTN